MPAAASLSSESKSTRLLESEGTLSSPAWLNCSQCKPPHLPKAQAFLTVNSQSWTPGRECRKREADCVDLGLLKASTEQNRGALVLRVPGPGCEPGHC